MPIEDLTFSQKHADKMNASTLRRHLIFTGLSLIPTFGLIALTYNMLVVDNICPEFNTRTRTNTLEEHENPPLEAIICMSYNNETPGTKASRFMATAPRIAQTPEAVLQRAGLLEPGETIHRDKTMAELAPEVFPVDREEEVNKTEFAQAEEVLPPPVPSTF